MPQQEQAQHSSYFEKVANEILQSAEHLTTRFEEGLSAMFLTGEGGDQQQQQRQGEHGFEDFDGLSDEQLREVLGDEKMMMGSPLEGIADSVIGDIVGGQVRTYLIQKVPKVWYSRSPDL